MKSTSLRAAEVVIVGGGIIGCSIAWHLTLRGQRDVLVLERNDIASGATARSAGLVARGRLHRPTMAMVGRTQQAITELEAQFGEPVGFRKVGSVRLAASAARAAELATMDGLLADAGVAVQTIDAGTAQTLVPWLDATQARRLSYLPDDGYVDAHQLTAAYARAARQLGVRIRVHTAVLGIIRTGDRVTGVRTGDGIIQAGAVIDAAGAWGIGLADDVGFGLGAAPVRSHYWITAPQPAWPRAHPLVYLPDARAYVRPEVGGMLLGVQEPLSRTYDARELPDDIADLSLSSTDDDWSVLVDNATALRIYIPGLDALPLAHHITGLSTYTPDGRFLLGRAGDIEGFWVASGCCGTGVSASGGIGASMASVVLHETPAIDLADFRPDRFGVINPHDEAFRERCAAARAGKLRSG